MTRAVVFAYHDVGVRCLRVLLAHGIDVPLVVTHADDPAETIWFDSVAAAAAERDIPVRVPDDPNAPALVAEIAALQPDFLFSFYYRRMLGAAPRVRYAWRAQHARFAAAEYRGRAP